MSLIEEFGLKQSQTPQDTHMICLQPFCWHCPTASPAPRDLLKSDPGGIVPWPPAGPFPCPCESHSCAVHPMAQHVGTALWNQGQFQLLPSQPPLLQTDLIASAAIQQLEGSGKALLCLCRCSGLSPTLAFHLSAAGPRSFQPCLCWRDLAQKLLCLNSPFLVGTTAVLSHSPGKNLLLLRTHRER